MMLVQLFLHLSKETYNKGKFMSSYKTSTCEQIDFSLVIISWEFILLGFIENGFLKRHFKMLNIFLLQTDTFNYALLSTFYCSAVLIFSIFGTIL